jgi:hypothetical protein
MTNFEPSLLTEGKYPSSLRLLKVYLFPIIESQTDWRLGSPSDYDRNSQRSPLDIRSIPPLPTCEKDSIKRIVRCVTPPFVSGQKPFLTPVTKLHTTTARSSRNLPIAYSLPIYNRTKPIRLSSKPGSNSDCGMIDISKTQLPRYC